MLFEVKGGDDKMYKTLSAPLTVQLELTTACTNKCLHCYNFWRNNNRQNSNLTPGQVKIIFQKLSNAQVFRIIITGGEPLLNKSGLFTCLKEASRFGIRVSLNSNMIPLSSDYVKDLWKLGLRNILTSLHGPNAEIHDKIVQKQGAFEKTISNIKLAKEIGMNVSVNMVVSKQSLPYIKQTAKLVDSLGIRSFNATRAGCPGNCSNFSDSSLSLKEFRSYLRDFLKAGQELKIKIDALSAYPLCGFGDLKIYQQLMGRKCYAGVTTFTVGSDGNVRPCSHLDLSYGNIFNDDVKSIWSRMDDWRRGKFLPDTCKGCSLLPFCGAGCRMEAKMRFGDLQAMDPYSSPSDVEVCFQQFKEIRWQKPKERQNVSAFVLNKIKWREESFGSVIMASENSRVFLNHDGTKLLKQLHRGKTHNINDKRLNWGKLNPQDFISELAERKVVSLIY